MEPRTLQAIISQTETEPFNITNVPKRVVRLLVAFLQVEHQNDEIDMFGLFTPAPVLQSIIEVMFSKAHSLQDLLYWLYDLKRRGYVAEYYSLMEEEPDGREPLFIILDQGLALLEKIAESRMSLFDSNSRNSLKGIH